MSSSLIRLRLRLSHSLIYDTKCEADKAWILKLEQSVAPKLRRHSTQGASLKTKMEKYLN